MRTIAAFLTAAATAALIAASCSHGQTNDSATSDTSGSTTSAGGSGGSGGSGGFGGSGGSADTCKTITLLYAPNDAGAPPTCTPAPCGSFDDSGHLKVTRDSWKGGDATLGKQSHITGDCRGSVVPTAPCTYQLLPNCVLVDEWITDLPWHQKLSTVHSNLIDVPFVLPFAALDFKSLAKDPMGCKSAATDTDKARCMLRYGVVNVMAFHRTDTFYPYWPAQAPPGQVCGTGDCVQTKLEIQRFHSLSDNDPGYEPDVIRNNRYAYMYAGKPAAVPSLGFAVSEATIFAPGRPWYMGHYCGITNVGRDAICYDDYFTTQLQAAANPPGSNWLTDSPAVFHPRGKDTFVTFCQADVQSCFVYLGKVDWVDNAMTLQPVNGDCPTGCGCNGTEDCATAIHNAADRLDNQFNASISGNLDIGRYPWAETTQDATALQSSIPTNPFIGFYQVKRTAVNDGKDTKASDRN